MTGVGLEVLLEDLIPEIALSGDRGKPLPPPIAAVSLTLTLTLTLTLNFTFASSWRRPPEMSNGASDMA
jgi:hypothetical protein